MQTGGGRLRLHLHEQRHAEPAPVPHRHLNRLGASILSCVEAATHSRVLWLRQGGGGVLCGERRALSLLALLLLLLLSPALSLQREEPTPHQALLHVASLASFFNKQPHIETHV